MAEGVDVRERPRTAEPSLTSDEVTHMPLANMIRITLFEDVWVIVLHPPAQHLALDPPLLAKIRETPKESHLGRERRAVLCTPDETTGLLHVFTAADSLFALHGDDGQVALAKDGRDSVIYARRKAGL